MHIAAVSLAYTAVIAVHGFYLHDYSSTYMYTIMSYSIITNRVLMVKVFDHSISW